MFYVYFLLFIRYERNWNIADEEDDPENDYMEAHKKFSSEPFDDHNNDEQFSNTQHRNVYNENYSRGQHDVRNFNNNYPGPLNQTRGSQMMRNTENDYLRPNSQISRNNQNYSHDMQTLKNTDENYYKPQNNIRNVDQRFPNEASLSNNNIDEEYSNEHIIDKNNLVSKRGDYGPPSRGNFKSSRGNYESFRGNYESSRGNYGPSRGNYGSSRGNGGNRDSFRNNFGNNNTNKTNMDWNEDYKEDEEPRQPPEEIIDLAPVVKRPYEAPPIDPIKIFDYRHLPTLKVIPGNVTFYIY